MSLSMSDDLERLALDWYKTRKAFLADPTVLDPTTKTPTLKNPHLLNDCAKAEAALAAECRAVLGE